MGNYIKSPIILNDSRLITELFQSSFMGKSQLLEMMKNLADQDAYALKKHLDQAIQVYCPRKIIVLVHVPPFAEVCMHKGTICTDDYLPFFSSKVTGDVLIEIAKDHENIEFLVLCGHTHSKGYFQPWANLTIKAGSAEYGTPAIQEIINL